VAGKHVIPPFFAVTVNKLSAELCVVQATKAVSFCVLLAFAPVGLAPIVIKTEKVDQMLAGFGCKGVASGSSAIGGGGHEGRLVVEALAPDALTLVHP
jgi:hypothetical protein